MKERVLSILKNRIYKTESNQGIGFKVLSPSQKSKLTSLFIVPSKTKVLK